MQRIKIFVSLMLIIMVVGMAVVSTSLIIKVTTPINNNSDDFKVYFSDVVVDGVKDLSLVQSETALAFSTSLGTIGDKTVVEYDVTNASKIYDAKISMTCTNSTDYVSISNNFDVSTNLVASSTRTGQLVVERSKSNIGDDFTQDISCTMTATAVGRTSISEGEISPPVAPLVPIGTEVIYNGEYFNVIDDDGTNVQLLARYNIDSSTNAQSETEVSEHVRWGDWVYVEEKDISDFEATDFEWGLDVSMRNYVEGLKGELGDSSLSANLITLDQLGELGCKISKDYIGSEYSEEHSSVVVSQKGYTCTASDYSEWLVNGQRWWTRSKDVYFGLTSTTLWVVEDDGELSIFDIADASYYGLRPVITVSKETYRKMANGSAN